MNMKKDRTMTTAKVQQCKRKFLSSLKFGDRIFQDGKRCDRCVGAGLCDGCIVHSALNVE